MRDSVVRLSATADLPDPIRRWSRLHNLDATFRPLGSFGQTWILDTPLERFVVKRIGAERARSEYEPVFQAAASAALGPPVIDSIGGEAGWYVVLGFVEGTPLTPEDLLPGRRSARLVQVIEAVTEMTTVPRLDLLDFWSSRLATFSFRQPDAEALRAWLFAAEPNTEPVLTHGDLIPQNVLVRQGWPVLIDWAQAGRAPRGFDAGWLLAVADAQGTPAADLAALSDELVRCGESSEALEWYARLGLLRLLWRCGTSPMRTELRVAIERRIGEVIRFRLRSDI